MTASRWLHVALSLAVLVWAPGLGWGATVVLTMAPAAQVRGPHIILGDVATVQGEPAELVARLQQAILGQAPPTGVERLLSRTSLVTQLKHQGFAVQVLQFEGPTQVRVTRAAQRLEPLHMEAAVRQLLSQRLPQSAQPSMIRDIRGLYPVLVSPGVVQYEVTLPGQHTVVGPNTFRLAISVDGKLEKQLHGIASIAMTQEVVSLTRPVAKDDIITAEAVSRTQVEVTQPVQQAVTRPEEVIGKRARRALAGNAPLSTQDVIAAPVVQKGDRVHIVLESSLIKVTTAGEALEPGKPGETIRVKNISSNREVRAQVIDKQTVRIQL
jgi:flagella basal body P-ring formation protein FlgA